MLTFENWGLIDYDQALDRQLALVQKIADGEQNDTLIFCTHPPIVTLGRKTQDGDVFAWDGPIKEIARGGRATYHGPSQLLIYPIINLDRTDLKQRPHRDINAFLRKLEDAIISALSKYDIVATGKSTQEETGVWVGNKKIASLGIGVKRWVTYHGAAINIDHDDKAFFGMNPCGFSNKIMTSIEEIHGHKVNRNELEDHLKNILSHSL